MMKTKKLHPIFALCFFFFTSQFALAQGFTVPKNYEFKTKEDYAKYESDVIDCVDWLVKTPLDQLPEKRQEANTFLIKWLSGSPSVTIELQENMVGFMKKNPDLLPIYLGGYTKYILENKQSEDKLQANVAALRSVIAVYKKGVGVKKDKEVEKLIEMDEKKELYKWVASQVGITDRLGRDEDMYSGSKSEVARSFYNDGYNYSKKGDLKSAIVAYRQAIEADKRYVEAYDNIAVCFRRLEMLDSAEYYYLKSIELYPQGPMAHQNLGLVYRMKQQPEKALEQYKILKKLTPESAEGAYGAAQVYVGMGDYENAIKEAEEAEKIYLAQKDPWIADAHFIIGLSYFELGKKSKGKSYLKKAIQGGAKLTNNQMKYFELD